jgi:hypothetical protein
MHNPPAAEEFLIRNSLESREIPCYSHQLGQSFPHLLGNIENGKSEKKSFWDLEWVTSPEPFGCFRLNVGVFRENPSL